MPVTQYMQPEGMFEETYLTAKRSYAEAISQKISQIMSLPSAQLGPWPVALY